MPLYQSYIAIPAAWLEGESCLPSILSQRNVQTEKPIRVTEDDEIFWDLGKVPNAMPYRMQSLYTRRREETQVPAVVLENDFLRAVFLPSLGGKLWSLFDKAGGRELLYVNDCIQPCNLAFRNAWTSGGVEWNLGVIAHSPMTCEPMTTAVLKDAQGQDVLRFYAFERIREVVYQMDFQLPESSRVLLCRMRIKNPHPRTIPMYWFSNIAVPKHPHGRVLVPASESYISDINGVGLTAVPINEQGADISYPENTWNAVDYFYKIPECSRRYIASFDQHGYGLFQTSTSRQRGRKLFVWGESAGGRSWQKWLTHQAGDYVEIQAGVNRTQYECIPMPPNVAWEWVEAYGPLALPEKTLHGDFAAACRAAEQEIESHVGQAWLEDYLRETKQSVALQKGRVLSYGPETAWGALENHRRRLCGEPVIEPHLDFGPMAEEQEPWRGLAEDGTFPAPDPKEPPASYMVSEPWFRLLRQATAGPETENWYAWFHLGLQYFQRGEDAFAEEAYRKSIALADNAWSWYALAALAHKRQDQKALEYLENAAPVLGGKKEFVREWMQLLCTYGDYGRALSLYESLADPLAADGRIRYNYAYALASLGRLEEAEAILGDGEEGVLVIDDLREGTTPLSDLWLLIKERRAAREGRAFDRNTAEIPPPFDYRMA